MVILKDQFDPELRKIIKKRKNAVVIPVGSIEQHGPHLPISTDSDIISEIAKRVSEKCNFLLAPTISYGISYEHSPFFNISIREKTIELLLNDICQSFVQNHIDTVFILNGHHGNQNALKKLGKKIKKNSNKNLRVFIFSYWHFMTREFDHAGFVETSLMLEISKKVKMTNAKKGLITKNLSKNEIQRLSKIASKSFPQATGNGVWGDPTKANAKEGKKILSEIVTNLIKKSQTCLTDKSRKLHH